MKYEIDVEEVLKQIRDKKYFTSKGGALAPLLKQITEAALAAELESHLSADLEKNGRLKIQTNSATIGLLKGLSKMSCKKRQIFVQNA